ncbi:hypothetical protein ACHAWF_001958 [Thalassiosira exigua]
MNSINRGNDGAADGGVAAAEEAAETSKCTKCDRDVPAANLVLHESRCAGAGAAGSRTASGRQQQQSSSSHSETLQRSDARATDDEGSESLELERGQQTLDRWLSRGSSSASGRSENNSAATEVSASGPAAAAVPTVTYDAPTETATFVGNIRPPTAHGVQLREGQWQCPRCTLVNENHHANCSVCLATRPSSTRPPDASTSERLIQRPVEDGGWVNVTYNPQFRRGRGGISRTEVPAPGMFDIQLPQNPLVHSTDRVGTVARVFNGAVNGAIVGSVLAGGGGLLVGGLAGALGGAFVDRSRVRREADELREMQSVATMLANDEGGIDRGTVRVHRSNGHITALASDGRGRHRVIRVRYDDSLANGRRQRLERADQAAQEGREDQAQLRQRVNAARDDVERSLLEVLVQMSYSPDFGPGAGNNIILQPEETFEELIQRFGLGDEGRGATQEIIDSYPVEIVQKDRREKEEEEKDEDESYSDSEADTDSDDESSEGAQMEGKTPEGEESSRGSADSETSEDGLGTCNICLEDFQEGERKKSLACPGHPHGFHQECIDKWLKVVASCPICKAPVGMYKN